MLQTITTCVYIGIYVEQKQQQQQQPQPQQPQQQQPQQQQPRRFKLPDLSVQLQDLILVMIEIYKLILSHVRTINNHVRVQR